MKNNKINCSIQLYRTENTRNLQHITAYYDGEFLKIEDYDIGESAKEHYGRCDHEMTYCFDKENTKLFYTKTNAKTSHQFMESIAQRFAGFDAMRKIEQWCEQKNIQYAVVVY